MPNMAISLTYASTQPHAYAYVGSLPVSVSWPSALHCYLCLTHCSPGNVPNPTPGPLMSTPLVNTGQPTLYNIFSMVCYIIAIILFQCGTK